MALVIRKPIGTSEYVWHHTLDWAAAILAGIIAGVVFVMLEMIMAPVFLGESPWGPPRMIAAIVMGREVLPAPGATPTFSMSILGMAMIVHLILSIIYAAVGGLFFHRLRLGPAVILGGFLGLLLYWINFYGFTSVFDWFAMARNWVSVLAHIVFGAIAAWSYKAFQHEVEPRRGVPTVNAS
jgi:uncharacterized membrane protein YagU involved in acid resistance